MGDPMLRFKTALLGGLFLVLIFPVPGLAADLASLHQNGLTVLYPPSLKAAAAEAVGLYPSVRKSLEESLRWRIDFQPTLILIKDRRPFVQMAGSDLFVAYAVPERGLMVIDYSRMVAHPFSIEVTMKHELCHLLLHRHIERQNLPKWLDEGVAQWVSGGLAEIVTHRKGYALKRATLTGTYLSWEALGDRFPREREALILAYEQSESLVVYIVTHFGLDGLNELLHHLHRGSQLEAAVSEAFFTTTDQLEAAWQRDLGRGLTLFSMMINHLYEILFFLGALLAVCGFIRYLVKKKAYDEPDHDATPLLF
jgi:hypothetical protein